MEASSSTAQQNSPQRNTNDQVSDIVNALTLPLRKAFEQLLKEMENSQNSQNSRQGNINDQGSVDVTALTLSLTEEFKQLHPVSEERCIYIVPKRLKALNEKAYTPRCVSIGPYHHGKDELKAMEEHKIMYLHNFLRFSRISLKTFVLCVKDNETRLRNCYQERIDLSSERFVRLMLVDAAFVTMVMLKRYSLQFRNEDEPLFNKPWMITDIQYDMILLENQLPFFIVHEFLALSNLVTSDFSMVKFSFDFVRGIYPSWMVNPSQELNFSHLVDFLRIGQQSLEQNKGEKIDVVNLPSAAELHQAGVKLKCGSSLRLVDINFRDGILEIPRLQLVDSTEILFRNLQAFEQCQIDSDKVYFQDYITMISLLVRNGKDVEILTKKNIIENWLHNNEQVVHLVHNLAKANFIYTEKFYFADVVNDLNKYCSKRRNRWRAKRSRWMASLIQNYFHNPWVFSVISATLLILVTIVQAIFSILQVKQQQ